MAAILLAQAAVYGMTTDLQLLKLLYPLVTHMPLVLVLDFSGVTFMDSSGIAVALRGWQRMRELGGSVTLRHVAQQPRKVFEAAGVGRMMTID